MELGLKDKVALVAASSRGLGFAIANSLAAEGMHLVICAREEMQLEKARENLAIHGSNVCAIPADLATITGIDRIIEAAMTQYGRIDVLVTNTGGPPPGLFETQPWESWRQAADLLLRSAIELARKALPGMRARQWGRIIGITSILARAPMRGMVFSNSLRAALTGAFRTLALEVACDGITVNTVLPGYFDTDRIMDLAKNLAATDATVPDAVRNKWIDSIPLGRLGAPDELASVVAYLASERARYITGQAIVVDGGHLPLLF